MRRLPIAHDALLLLGQQLFDARVKHVLLPSIQGFISDPRAYDIAHAKSPSFLWHSTVFMMDGQCKDHPSASRKFSAKPWPALALAYKTQE